MTITLFKKSRPMPHPVTANAAASLLALVGPSATVNSVAAINTAVTVNPVLTNIIVVVLVHHTVVANTTVAVSAIMDLAQRLDQRHNKRIHICEQCDNVTLYTKKAPLQLVVDFLDEFEWE
jgi:hypothetical protein